MDVPVIPLATARAAQVESAISGAAALASGAEAVASDASGWWLMFLMLSISAILFALMSRAIKSRDKAGASQNDVPADARKGELDHAHSTRDS